MDVHRPPDSRGLRLIFSLRSMTMSPVSVGFAPISGSSARVLILGSLPGEESLRRQQYYAHPRNVFWQIMGDLVGAAPELPYAARIEALIANGVAVWDVCAAAYRSGSLDSSIDLKSVNANDFQSFFARHPRLSLVCFNGTKASALYDARVMPSLSADMKRIRYTVLPSTSPAHASVPYESKRSAWEIVRER
jgi:TDG/mug DNA glycosylase family protein